MTALMALAVLVIGAVLVAGVCLKEQALTTDFTRKNIAPCIQYPFGTDWMGRDMFVRTLTGLSLSIRIGLITSAFSSLIAVGMGLACAAGGKWADSLISGFIDLVMGIPHILLLILISFALGKGLKGVATGIILTHWTSLARLIRGEVLQLKESHFIKIAEKMGMSPWQIGVKHMMPHLLPQVLVGMVLMFPSASAPPFHLFPALSCVLFLCFSCVFLHDHLLTASIFCFLYSFSLLMCPGRIQKTV